MLCMEGVNETCLTFATLLSKRPVRVIKMKADMTEQRRRGTLPCFVKPENTPRSQPVTELSSSHSQEQRLGDKFVPFLFLFFFFPRENDTWPDRSSFGPTSDRAMFGVQAFPRGSKNPQSRSHRPFALLNIGAARQLRSR